MNNKSNIMVIAAHPDDETLGCGASIHKHVQQGDNVFVLILSNGVGSRTGDKKSHADEIDLRLKSAEKSCMLLGVESLILKDYPDNLFDTCPLLDIIQDIEKEIIKHCPDTIYTHSNTDLNVDHQIVNRAVITACRPYPDQPVRKILEFETLSSTEWFLTSSHSSFSPNYYIDVTDSYEYKEEAFSFYTSEIQDYPSARSLESIKALAMYRGTLTGVKFAEAFSLQRSLI